MNSYTWELSGLDVSTSPTQGCFFLSVKLEILSVAQRTPNSYFISKPQSNSIQSPMETLVKKLGSLVICLFNKEIYYFIVYINIMT